MNLTSEIGKDLPAYLDNMATTPLDPRVLDSMLPFLSNNFGNPHSKSHKYGWDTEIACEDARGHIAATIGAVPKEVIFTSGATESTNLGIKGAAQFYGDRKKHIITTQICHKATLDTCDNLSENGFDITYLPVEPKTGQVNLDTL